MMLDRISDFLMPKETHWLVDLAILLVASFFIGRQGVEWIVGFMAWLLHAQRHAHAFGYRRGRADS